VSTETLRDMLLRQLEGGLPADAIDNLVDWIMALLVAARREGREDGLWEA
jgi:hypothetical protein